MRSPKSSGGMRCRANSAGSSKSSRAISTRRNPNIASFRSTRATTPRPSRAAIFAFRSRTQPAIVQVNEIATATMMAAKRRDLSGARADARRGGAVPAVRLSSRRHRLLHRSRRQHAVVSVQRVDADPLLQQGAVPQSRARSGSRAEDLARGRRGGAAAARGGRCLRPHHVTGRPGSMSRISPRCTIVPMRPRPTALAGSMRS